MTDTRKSVLLLMEDMFLNVAPKFKYINSVNSWPLFKAQVGYLLTFIKEEKIDPKLNDTDFKLKESNPGLSELVKLPRRYFKIKALERKFKNACKDKVLLFGFQEHYYRQGNENINLYLTPFEKELEDCEIGYDELLVSNTSVPATRDGLYQFYSHLEEYYRKLYHFKKELNYTSYQNASLVKEFLDEKKTGYSSYVSKVVYQAQSEQEIKYKAFSHFLKIVRPKLVWTYCYYDNSVMAMVRAANKVHVPCIEYQHSAQSDEHNAYSKWPASDSYKNFFPRYFWVWQDTDKERIIRNFSDKAYKPRVIVGGNLASIQQKKLMKYDPLSEKGVLVSLQGAWIPGFVEEAIEEDHAHTWYFRLHPRYPADKEKLDALKNKFPDKIEFDKANQLSIHELFNLVKINITDYSGVALEAFDFGVKNIIVGELGRQTYKKLIDSNNFLFIDTKTALLHAVNAINKNQVNVSEQPHDTANLIKKLLNDNA